MLDFPAVASWDALRSSVSDFPIARLLLVPI